MRFEERAAARDPHLWFRGGVAAYKTWIRGGGLGGGPMEGGRFRLAVTMAWPMLLCMAETSSPKRGERV